MSSTRNNNPPGCFGCFHASGPVDSEFCEKCFDADDDNWPGYAPLTEETESHDGE